MGPFLRAENPTALLTGRGSAYRRGGKFVLPGGGRLAEGAFERVSGRLPKRTMNETTAVLLWLGVYLFVFAAMLSFFWRRAGPKGPTSLPR